MAAVKRSKQGADEGADERAAAIVAELGEGSASAEEVFAAFEALDALPEGVVRRALAAWTGEPPDLDRLDDATRAAHRLPPRPLHLRLLSVVKDADILDLGDVALEQLRLAGKSWDGVDREPEERLDEEVEGSFAGTLEHRVYADAADASEAPRPVFDVMLFAGDNAIVFRAGTTEQLGSIADGVVELRDRRSRAALQEAITPAPAAASAPAPKKRSTTKKKAAAAPKKAKAAAKKKTSAAPRAKKKTASKKRTES